MAGRPDVVLTCWPTRPSTRIVVDQNSQTGQTSAINLASERNHQGLANVLLTGTPTPANTSASVFRRERLGGLLNYYHCATVVRPDGGFDPVLGNNARLMQTDANGASAGQSIVPLRMIAATLK